MIHIIKICRNIPFEISLLDLHIKYFPHKISSNIYFFSQHWERWDQKSMTGTLQ